MLKAESPLTNSMTLRLSSSLALSAERDTRAYNKTTTTTTTTTTTKRNPTQIRENKKKLGHYFLF